MTGPRPLAVYEDFSLGEFGQTGAWAAPKGSWTGLNVMRYQDGSLGPRAGLAALVLTGMPAGDVLAMGTGKTTAGLARCWFIKATTVYSFDPIGGGAVTAYTGALTTAPRAGSAPAYVNTAQLTYLLNATDGKLYKIDHTALTVTSPITLTAGSAVADVCLAQLGERTVWGTNISRRLSYSAAGLPESWPAANYIDVGDAALGISGLFPQRQHLAIAKAIGGFVGEWWVLTGVPGVNETLRLVGIAPTPESNYRAALTGGADVAWVSSHQEGAPSRFNGSATRAERHLRDASTLQYTDTAPGWYPDDWMHVARATDSTEMRVLVRRGGTWTRHRLEAGPTGYSLARARWAYFAALDLAVFCSDDRTTFWRWSAYNDDPSAGTGVGGYGYGGVLSPTSPALCAFTLPEWWAGDGHETSVRAVQVDFRSFAVGSGNATWAVTLTPLRQSEGGEGVAQAFAFAEAAPAASVNRRRQALFAIDDANGFQLGFSNLRGVSIQKITVLGTARPAQGVA